MLHADEIQRILVELGTGKSPTLRNEEADAFRAQVTQEIAEIKGRGYEVEIPFEIPDLD